MLQQSRTLAGALMSALIVLAVVMYVVLSPHGHVLALPPLWVFGVQVAAGLAAHAVAETLGYRAPALDPQTDPDQAMEQAQAAYRSLMFLRFAACESIAMLSLAFAFILPHGGWVTYVSGALVSLALMAVHVWPGPRPIGKVETSLQRNGSRVSLREAFGLDHRLSGPIQEL